MPAMTINKMNGASANGEVDGESPSEKIIVNNIISNNSRSNTDTLLDLLAGDDIIMSTPTASVTSVTPAATSNLLDLLGDIDISAPSVSVMNNNNNLSSPITMSIFDDNENTKIPSDGSIFNINGSGGAPVSGVNYDLGLDFLSSPTTTTTTTSVKTITVFDKNDLLITFANTRQGDSIQVMMTTTNNSMDSIDQYLFQVIILNCEHSTFMTLSLSQAAVPKSFQLQMLPPSGSVILPGGQITQEMRVKNNSPSVS
jgi:AP-1 complex subunit gamma-1